MSKTKKIAVNSISLIGGQFFQRLLGLVLVMVIARSYGRVLLGQYSFMMVYMTLFAMVASFGFQTVMVRDVAADTSKAKSFFPNIIAIQFLLGFFLLAPMAWLLWILGKEINPIIILLFALSLIFMENTSSIAASILEGMDKMRINALFLFLKRALTTSIVIVLVFFKRLDLLMLGFVVFGVSFFNMVSYLLILKKGGILDSFHIEISVLRRLIWIGFPFLVLKCVIIMFNRVDVVMLSSLRGDEEVGVYSAAYYILESFMIIANSFAVAFFPTMVQSLKESRGRLITLFHKAFKLLFVTSLLSAFLISISSQSISLLFYGKRFQQTGIVLSILIWTLVFFSMNLPSSRLLFAADRKNALVSIFGGGLLLNIGMNFFLIPKMGSAGAAIATVISMFFIFSVIFGYMNRFLFRVKLLKNCWRPIVSIGLVVVIFKIIHNWNLVLLMVVSLVAYSGFLYLFKVVDAKDIELFRKVMFKKKGSQVALYGE